MSTASEAKMKSERKELLKAVIQNTLDFKRTHDKRLGWTPAKGHVWNPLRTLPRNMPCICGKAKKFKKCCLDKLPRIVTAKKAREFEAWLTARAQCAS